MEMMENSHRSNKSARLPDVGRPRVRALTETINIGFKADPELVRALDEEAAHLTSERGPGASKVSRTEAIKVILAKWMADRSKKPRQ
jgi:hypothetical protein